MISLIASIAPSVGNKLLEYSRDKKLSNQEVQIILLSKIIEQNDNVCKILENHIIHEMKMIDELVQALRNLRADLMRVGNV